MAVYRSLRRAGEAEIEILYKVCGRGTALLAEALEGQRIRVVGPLGRGFAEPPPGGRSILVGGGTGIASLYQLASRALHSGEVQVLLGACTAVELMGRGDFEKLGVGLEIATEDGSAGRRGLVTEPLEEALAQDPDATVYACGPTPMMRRCAEIAGERRARCYVSLENAMACGFGVCLGCASPRAGGGYALVCRDGPVFDAVEVDWEELP
jgi:dihydroorotate dehydrogenase electron transfer subunit